jgi:hypothetical protein
MSFSKTASAHMAPEGTSFKIAAKLTMHNGKLTSLQSVVFSEGGRWGVVDTSSHPTVSSASPQNHETQKLEQ